MSTFPDPLDLSRVKVFPLRERKSLSRIETILVDPASNPAGPIPSPERLARCADRMRRARQGHGSIVLIYGAHLVKNGGSSLIRALLDWGWITHLATNGAG